MRISDWSSDVCSSDLLYFVARSWIGAPDGQFYDIPAFVAHDGSWLVLIALLGISVSGGMFVVPLYAFLTTTVNKSETARTVEIGRASCRERVGQYVKISAVAESLKKKKISKQR